MKAVLTDEALAYLEKKSASVVTLELEDLETSCCLGRVPEISLTLTPPTDKTGFRHFSIRGIDLYLPQHLRSQETVTLFLSGIGPFKKLEVSGIHLIL